MTIRNKQCIRCEKDYLPWFDEQLCELCLEEIWEDSSDEMDRMSIKVSGEDPWDSIREAEITGN